MVTEAIVCQNLEPYLTGRYGRFVREVPLCSKRIDYVCLDPETNEVVAIEAKVQDWKKGLSQALLYRICADKVYLALWHEYLRRVTFEVFEDYGIGVLRVDGCTEEVLKPSFHDKTQKSLIHEIKRKFCENTGEVEAE